MSSLSSYAVHVHEAALDDAEDHGEILLIGHLNPAVLIRVVTSEYVRQPLQDDASLDEVIKGNLPSSLSVKLPNEDVVELVREPVAKT